MTNQGERKSSSILLLQMFITKVVKFIQLKSILYIQYPIQ